MLRGYIALKDGLEFLQEIDPSVFALEARGVEKKLDLYDDEGNKRPNPPQKFNSEGQPVWSVKTLVLSKDEDGNEQDRDELVWTLAGSRPEVSRGQLVVPVRPMIGQWPANGKTLFQTLSAEGFMELDD